MIQNQKRVYTNPPLPRIFTVDRQQTDDPPHVLEVHGSDPEVRLELRETFLNDRLSFVGFEHLLGVPIRNVRNQREHPVSRDGPVELAAVDFPGQIKARLHFPFVLSVLRGPSAAGLSIALLLLRMNLDTEQIACLMGVENGIDGGDDFLLFAETGPFAAQPHTKIRQFANGSLQPAGARGRVRVLFAATVKPHQPITFFTELLLGANSKHVAQRTIFLGEPIQFPPADRLRLLPQTLAKLRVFLARRGQDCDEAASLTSDRIHVVRGRQFAVRDVHEVGPFHQLGQQLPGRLVRLVVRDVAAGGLKIDRHAAIFRDRQNVEQLFEIRPMVFVVPPRHGGRRAAEKALFGGGVGIVSEKRDRCGVVVQFIQTDPEFPHHMGYDIHD